MGFDILTIIIVLILVALWVIMGKYKVPSQESNESDEDYQQRIKKYNCEYEGNRNLLLVGLGLSVGTYLYRGKSELKPPPFTGGGEIGGFSESMDEDEQQYYNPKKEVESPSENKD